MNILKQILLEMNLAGGNVDANEISNAVTNMLSANITYNDEHPGKRTICPVAYGVSTAGNPVVRAFQKSGETGNGWRLFSLSNITSWNTLSNEKYNPDELVGFNKDGDKQMDVIYSIAPIGNAKEIEVSKNQNVTDKLTDGPVTKRDILNLGQEKEEKPSDNTNYTAYNAIDDTLISADASNLSKKVDNEKEKQYNINDKINAPEAKPVMSSDIPGGEKEAAPDENNSKQDNTTMTSEPITKDEINQDNELTSSFNDMMNRMNNLNKEED